MAPEEVTPEMVEAVVIVGQRFAAAVGVLSAHLDELLEICGDAGDYPAAARRKIEAARRAAADMRGMDLGAWVRRHVGSARLAS